MTLGTEQPEANPALGILGGGQAKLNPTVSRIGIKLASPWETDFLDLCSQGDEWFVFTAEAAFSAKSPALP